MYLINTFSEIRVLTTSRHPGGELSVQNHYRASHAALSSRNLCFTETQVLTVSLELGEDLKNSIFGGLKYFYFSVTVGIRCRFMSVSGVQHAG